MLESLTPYVRLQFPEVDCEGDPEICAYEKLRPRLEAALGPEIFYKDDAGLHLDFCPHDYVQLEYSRS